MTLDVKANSIQALYLLQNYYTSNYISIAEKMIKKNRGNETGALYINAYLFLHYLINPILPRLWKDVVTQEGHYGPPLFFWLWGYQKPKT